jgi:hypothetical protein
MAVMLVVSLVDLMAAMMDYESVAMKVVLLVGN